ncbi:hypothetical protein TsFJ059_004805 [Trichoderma semiorbis]|uniref:Uncharacterized protein n=1 Tax=Trichoderma semiorbis TaxID=1491008 RepID=A0A9P8HRR0_9HYPO|nr:hypothetical protein TsFJ059_004805 [Trichoderma semiorbis]
MERNQLDTVLTPKPFSARTLVPIQRNPNASETGRKGGGLCVSGLIDPPTSSSSSISINKHCKQTLK